MTAALAVPAFLAGTGGGLGAGLVLGSRRGRGGGRIGLHRKVVLLGGAVAMWVAFVCLAVVLGLLPAAAGLVLAVAVVIVYGFVLGTEGGGLERLVVPQGWAAWLRSAVSEEELEL